MHVSATSRTSRPAFSFAIATMNPIELGQGTFPLSLEEKALTENRKGRFRIEFPFRLDKDIDRLRTQKLRMDVSVKSTTEGEELKKAVSFQLKF